MHFFFPRRSWDEACACFLFLSLFLDGGWHTLHAKRPVCLYLVTCTLRSIFLGMCAFPCPVTDVRKTNETRFFLSPFFLRHATTCT